MAKKKASISFAKQGMQRNVAPNLVDKTAYTFGLNLNTESETGDRINIISEPSSLLTTRFPSGYKVIGYVSNISKNITYYWLTNPTTKRSSIGYVSDIPVDIISSDPYNNCVGCQKEKDLSTPLENTTEYPTTEYVEMVNDICNGDLKFDINYPIKTPQLKQEKLGDTLYWTDNLNPQRYLKTYDLEYYKYTGEIICQEDNRQQICPNPFDGVDVTKLLMSPNYKVPRIQAELIQIGGNLKFGTYSFLLAYCDVKGNKITQYFSPTNPISIFDENNNILTQPQLNQLTNFAIKLKVENLDTRFKYYKVAVVERVNLVNTESYYIEGIHPTTDDTILYTTSASIGENNNNADIVSPKERTTLEDIMSVHQSYEKVEFFEKVNGKLFQGGLTAKKTMNLQPIVNIIGGFLKWQTTVAKEDLYKDLIATSKYKGYTRDEVQPFAMRFFDSSGDYTYNFPLVPRPAIDWQKDEETTVNELDQVDIDNDPNYISLNANAPTCSNGRDKYWQIYNTAVFEGECDNAIQLGSEVIYDQTKSCFIKNVNSIESNTYTLYNVEDYVDLKTYLNDNIEAIKNGDIPGLVDIQDALNEEYLDSNCVAIQGCENINLESSINLIGDVEENPLVPIVINYKDINDYVKSLPPTQSNVYILNQDDQGRKIKDSGNFLPCNGTESGIAYLRNVLNNESCNYAEEVVNNNTPTTPGSSNYSNYYHSPVLADILTTKEVSETSSYFQPFLHKGALWFKINRGGRDRLIFEITKNSICTVDENVSVVNEARFTFYANSSTTEELTNTTVSAIPKIFDTTEGVLIELTDFENFPSDYFYVAIDSPLIEEEIPTIKNDCPIPIDTFTSYRTAPACGTYSVYTRDAEKLSIDVAFNFIKIDKRQTYSATCTRYLPKVDSCHPTPYQYGTFAYWESVEDYPNNAELYDSSNLIISTSDFEILTNEQKEKFELYYKEDMNGDLYVLKNLDLRCSKIRHYRFPDNNIAPFMNDFQTDEFTETLIFPLGVTLDNRVVNTFLDIAVKNQLITQEQRDSIVGYEILKGDNSINKSIIANALGYDMYKYEERGKEVFYPNFPHNDLGLDLLHVDGNENYLEHPHGGILNNKFSLISPEFIYSKPILPNEIKMSGYQIGQSKGEFVDMEDHSKWVILSSKGRNWATILATAEGVLELAQKTGELTKDHWATFGLSNGGSVIGIVASGIAIAAIVFAEAIRVGKYRFQWMETFKNLGEPQNFASIYASEGFHNQFLKNEDLDFYTRAIPLRKYMRDGKYKYTDETTGDRINVNNYMREYSVFVSLGKTEDDKNVFRYRDEYVDNDNNSKYGGLEGSRLVASHVDCPSNLSGEIIRNVGSPYFTLKNYLPAQFGQIDSIQWLTTGFYSDINNFNTCSIDNIVFGGNTFISRFTYHRKHKIFKTDAYGLPARLPFNYYDYPNVGIPKYWCSYDTGGDADIDGFKGVVFPEIKTDYSFDCETKRNAYVKKPSKLYTQYHGIANFLVESEINCNFRYGKTDIRDQFYPQSGDLITYCQEKNLSISQPNTFYYNSVYSLPVRDTPYLIADRTYSRNLQDIKNSLPNGVRCSESDESENDFLVDPWLIYKPLNTWDFGSKNGKLIGLKNLESEIVLARFEDGLTAFNKIDNLANQLTPQMVEVGSGGIFAKRPFELRTTDLGIAGTQNTDCLSTPYGRYFVDAKRGKVWQIDENGNKQEPISEMVGGKESGLKNWFREQLPFKILKYFPDVDIDNKFKGIGISMGWDARFDRVFITKKDYIPKSECITYQNGDFYNNCAQTDCTLDNLVVNGNFTNDLSGWDTQYPDQYVWDGGKAWFSEANDQAPKISQNILEVGETYIIKLDFTINNSCGENKYVRIWAGTNYTSYYTETDSIEIVMTCAGNTTFAIECVYTCTYSNPTETISIDNVCVRKQSTQRLIQLSNTNFFEEVSWTVAYKPLDGSWVSYYSFKPDYYVNHNNYFKTGLNFYKNSYQETLNSHLLTNKSFGVFYGEKFPFIVEVPIESEYVSKVLESVKINIEAKRFQNEYDYAVNKDIGFDSAVIYNATNNSGLLKLAAQKNMNDIRNYPKTSADKKQQEILFSSYNGYHTFNYFFNRVVNQNNNVEQWVNDRSYLNKTLNTNVVNFKESPRLDRIKGEYFLVRLSNENDSLHQITLKNVISGEKVE